LSTVLVTAISGLWRRAARATGATEHVSGNFALLALANGGPPSCYLAEGISEPANITEDLRKSRRHSRWRCFLWPDFQGLAVGRDFVARGGGQSLYHGGEWFAILLWIAFHRGGGTISRSPTFALRIAAAAAGFAAGFLRTRSPFGENKYFGPAPAPPVPPRALVINFN